MGALKKFVFTSAFWFCLCMLTHKAQAQSEDFEKSLAKHLQAVRERNISNVAATVSDQVLLIFPDGEVLKSKEKFVDFHKEWFKDTLWQLEHEIINTKKSQNLGYALVRYQLKKFNADKTPKSVSNAFLMLVFEKQAGSWKLVHDQNTKIE